MKKNRIKRKTYLFVPEGYREEYLLKRFKELYPYDKNKVSLTILDATGGSPDSIINKSLNESGKKYYVYILLDDDKKLEEEHTNLMNQWGVDSVDSEIFKGKLPSEVKSYNTDNRKPILIVSTPLTIENVVLDLFEVNNQSKNVETLKGQVKQLKKREGFSVKKEGDLDLFNLLNKKDFERSTNSVIKELVNIFSEIEKISSS